MRKTQARSDRVQAAMARHSRSADQEGAGGARNVLLSSGSLTEFSDRLQFLGAVERNDSDLVALAEVSRERLRRDQQDLVSLAKQEQVTAATLRTQEAAMTSRFHDEQSLVDQLTQKLKAEQRTRAQLKLFGVHTVTGGVLATCPVAGPHFYVDTFGAPRPGGRTHQGDD